MNENKLIAVGLILTIGVFLAAGCLNGGSTGYPQTPSGVVKAFVEALNQGSMEEAKKYTTQSWKNLVNQIESDKIQQFTQMTKQSNIKVSKITEKETNKAENKTTLKIEVKVETPTGKTLTNPNTYQLTKTNGKWKINQGAPGEIQDLIQQTK